MPDSHPSGDAGSASGRADRSSADMPFLTPQQQRLTGEGSGLQLYRELAVGSQGWLALCWFEFVTLLCSWLPGILGFGLRAAFYPGLMNRCGKRPAFGRGVVLRNPGSISLGDKVMVDDYAVLDVRGGAGSLTLDNFVSVGRFTTIAAKEGSIRLHAGVNVGSYCRIATQSKVEIGESVLIGAYSYIGPGNHQQGDGSKPLIAREMEIKGGVSIGAHAWIGAGVTILDGVTIGERAIVGAHSLVLHDVPAGATVAGSPAKVLKGA